MLMARSAAAVVVGNADSGAACCVRLHMLCYRRTASWGLRACDLEKWKRVARWWCSVGEAIGWGDLCLWEGEMMDVGLLLRR